MKPVGRDPEFRYAVGLAEKLSREKRPVIIVGETGSGKSYIARYIHEKSGTEGEPFIEWHAGSVPESLIESEILGVERGVATGVLPRIGILEAAGGGTLGISGLEEIPPSAQAIFLRLVESGEFEKIGATRKTSFRGRMIASFPEDPGKLVKEGKLRADLLYRLDVFRIDLPPLRERRGDIARFITAFMKQECRKAGKKVPEVSQGLARCLESHGWPGNVRELENVVRQLCHSGSDPLEISDLPPNFLFPGDEPVSGAVSERLTLDELKRRYSEAVLKKTGGRRGEAARWIGISRKSLWEHLKEDKE